MTKTSAPKEAAKAKAVAKPKKAAAPKATAKAKATAKPKAAANAGATAKPKKAVAKAPAKAAEKPAGGESPSKLIDGRIEELGGWRGKTLGRLRALIKETVPDVVEEWKWRGVPVWYKDGMVCTGEAYKAVVKVTFAKGAALEDPSKLFNSSLDGNVRRAIDFHEGDAIDEKAFKALVRAAVELNASK